MTYKNVQNIGLLSLVAMFALIPVVSSQIHAEESEGYNMVGDVTPVLTFTFRNGVEVVEFPVFEMGENFVSNSGTTFTVQGSVTKSPMLHEALDQAYAYRLVSGNGYEYPFKYFDVDADFVKDGESIFSLDYNNCRVQNYQVETLDSNDYESYFKSVGFAIVDIIDFECSGVNFDTQEKIMSTNTSFTDFGESGFAFANDMRTDVTFSFAGGKEKIEFPFFELTSGFEESDDNVTAEFAVEGILDYYPLLYKAIDNARKVSGNSHVFNTDFDALVEFTNGEETYRAIDFRDCRVSESEITTRTDKEEGFTGKSGFAVVNKLGFECAGMKPINNYEKLRGNGPIWQTAYMTNLYDEPIQNTDKDLSAMVTITTSTGSETIEFSMFKQNNVLTSFSNSLVSYPTFELRGIVGNYPILYKIVDDNRKLQSLSGTGLKELVNIDVDIVSGDDVIRGFNYSNCRPIDYMIATGPNSEESYVKNSFALENIFDFECQGYHPNNPVYDVMHSTYKKSNAMSTSELRNTDTWKPGFYIP